MSNCCKFQHMASLVVQKVENLPEMQETQVQFLGWEDSLEKGMATHSSTLEWRIPWTEEPGGLQSMGVTKRPERLTFSLSTYLLAITGDGQRSLACCSSWGRKESDMTERLN